MNLSEQTSKMVTEFIAGLPDETRDIVQQAFAAIQASEDGANALREGEQSPDFCLPNARGGETRLSDLLQQGPVVLNFYRGGWCPFCNLEFKALHDVLPRIKQLGATLVGISPELPDNSVSTVEKHQLQFEVLSDVGLRVIRQFGILTEVPAVMQPLYHEWGLDVPAVNGTGSWELPIPATYIINQDGRIVSAYVNKNYTERMEPTDIISQLEKLMVVS